jgi:hypothetical protein
MSAYIYYTQNSNEPDRNNNNSPASRDSHADSYVLEEESELPGLVVGAPPRWKRPSSAFNPGSHFYQMTPTELVLYEQRVEPENWAKLPMELWLCVFDYLPIRLLSDLYATNRSYHRLIRDNFNRLLNYRANRELERIEAQYDYKGLSFFEGLLKWVRSKPLHVDIPGSHDDVRCFVQEYCRCNTEKGQRPVTFSSDLIPPATGLASLHINMHASDGIDEDERAQWMSNIEIERERLAGYRNFPAYARISSPVPYFDLIKSDSSLLGEVKYIGSSKWPLYQLTSLSENTGNLWERLIQPTRSVLMLLDEPLFLRRSK